MIDLRAYNDKTVGIYGAGTAGLSAHAALNAAGAHVFFWDDSASVRDKLAASGIACTAPRDWPWAEMAVVVPGFSNRTGFLKTMKILSVAAEHKVPVRSDIDLFAEAIAAKPAHARPKIVGITGTHGKSVTGALVTHILTASGRDAWLGGTAGDAVLNLPEGGAETTYVLEILPQTLAFTRQLHCDAAMLLNLTSLDLRFFKSPDQAIGAATRIFRNTGPDDAVIIGVDDFVSQKICTAITANTSGRITGSDTIIAVSGEATLGLGVFSLDGRVFDARSDKTVTLGNVARAPAILGNHFNQCCAAAFAACLHLGLSSALISRAIHSWPGLPGRMYCLGDHAGVVYFDDGASMWLPSTAAALNAGEDIIWIGGGDDRQRDYRKLRDAGTEIRHAFLYGDAAKSIRKAAGSSFDCTLCDSFDDAVKRAIAEARRLAEAGGAEAPLVLFSPGCPGTDQPDNQAVFTRTVQDLLESEAA